MRIKEAAKNEAIIRALAEPDCRRIISLTMSRPLPVAEVSAELGIPVRSVYRYMGDLCDLGLMTGERGVIVEGGGKYQLYRSMVRAVNLTYASEKNLLEIDLLPNEGILDRFLRFWTYMGA